MFFNISVRTKIHLLEVYKDIQILCNTMLKHKNILNTINYKTIFSIKFLLLCQCEYKKIEAVVKI